MKARHPEKFHRRLEVEDNRKRKGYEEAELVILAEAEVDLPPDTRYINKVLAALKVIERTREQIRQMSKRARYKELVQDLKLAREHTDQNLMEELSSVSQPSLCDTLKSFLKKGDFKYLEFFECASRGHAQGWPQSSVEELDQVLRQSYPFLFTRDKVRKSGMLKLQDWREPQLNGRQRKQVRYRTTQRERTDRIEEVLPRSSWTMERKIQDRLPSGKLSGSIVKYSLRRLSIAVKTELGTPSFWFQTRILPQL